jgi:tetratricopeptide repeat protein 21B
LGESLIKIQEPEEAIVQFEKALKDRPEDSKLIREIGQALVMTHDYNKAIE